MEAEDAASTRCPRQLKQAATNIARHTGVRCGRSALGERERGRAGDTHRRAEDGRDDHQEGDGGVVRRHSILQLHRRQREQRRPQQHALVDAIPIRHHAPHRPGEEAHRRGHLQHTGGVSARRHSWTSVPEYGAVYAPLAIPGRIDNMGAHNPS